MEHFGKLGSTPDERIDRRGQVVRGLERAQWREVALERGVRELPDFDIADVFQVVTAQIHRRDVGPESVRYLADENFGRRG